MMEIDTYSIGTYSSGERVTFKARKLDIREEGNRLICSLEGEFLRDGNPLVPPMTYSMANVGVTTRDPVSILRPVYVSLLAEREPAQK